MRVDEGASKGRRDRRDFTGSYLVDVEVGALIDHEAGSPS